MGAVAGDPPVLWVTERPMRDAGRRWQELHRLRSRTGLWPLVLNGLDDEPNRPWFTGEFDPVPVDRVTSLFPEAVLAELWQALTADMVEEDGTEGHDAPTEFGLPTSWTGLAPGSLLEVDPEAHAARVAANVFPEAHLGLVPADRGSSAVAVLGWDGPVNHANGAQIAAVLRSWEDRFGARVVGLGFDTLEMSVAAPPVSLQHARRLAAEHYAFCPDNIAQGPGDFELYAKHIRGTTTWSFWWD
jgi:hypothetical protein